jgi:hypothetical protein
VLRAQHAAAKKKARKQREKEAAEGATADGSCAQRLADPNAKKMTKNRERQRSHLVLSRTTAARRRRWGWT